MANPSKVTQLITDDIISGRLRFGARLTIDELATRYGVSHMPVREALRELSGAGLLEIGSGRSAWVRRVDAAYVRNLFNTRSALEVMVMKEAARNMTPAILRTVLGHQEDLEAAAEARNGAAFLRANHAFHQTINATAGNTEAVQIIDRQWVLMQALWGRVGYGPERFAGVISDHRHICTALADGDVEAAGVLQAAHVLKAKYSFLSRLSELNLVEFDAA